MKLAEPYSKRINREKLEALKRFIPIHEKLHDKLQEEQQMRTNLLTGRQDEYKPITESIETMLRGGPEDIFTTDKKPISGLLEEISENIKSIKQPELAEASGGPPEESDKKKLKI